MQLTLTYGDQQQYIMVKPIHRGSAQNVLCLQTNADHGDLMSEISDMLWR